MKIKMKILIAILTVGVFSISTIKAQENTMHMKKDTMKMNHSKMHMKDGKMDMNMKMDHSKMQMKDGKMDMDNTKMAKMYNCPMHHDYVSDKPGECPKCGMTLVKKENTKQKEEHHKHK